MPKSYQPEVEFRPSNLFHGEKVEGYPYFAWTGSNPFVNPRTGKRRPDSFYGTSNFANQLGQDVRKSILTPMGRSISTRAKDPVQSTAAAASAGGLLGLLLNSHFKGEHPILSTLGGAALAGGGVAGLNYYNSRKK